MEVPYNIILSFFPLLHPFCQLSFIFLQLEKKNLLYLPILPFSTYIVFFLTNEHPLKFFGMPIFWQYILPILTLLKISQFSLSVCKIFFLVIEFYVSKFIGWLFCFSTLSCLYCFWWEFYLLPCNMPCLLWLLLRFYFYH